MRLFRWALLLCKRLYKKATFLLILLLIPAVVLGFSFFAKGESGFVHVLLVQEDPAESLSSSLVRQLKERGRLIRFSLCDSPVLAEEYVREGRADSAWIFASDMQERVVDYFERPEEFEGLVTILERETTVPLRLAREQLCGALFECCSQQLFLNHVREHSVAAQSMTDEELLVYYRNAFTAMDGLFEFSYLDSDASSEEIHYLTEPLRGLLAVIVTVCAFATGVYFLQDHGNGLFSWLPARRLNFVELGYQAVSVLNVSFVCLIALLLAGFTENIFYEFLVVLLYSLCVSVFGCFVRALFGSSRVLAVFLPLSALLMIALCPIFFPLPGALKPLSLLFPPTYYLRSVLDESYLLSMLLYTLVLWVCYRILSRFRRV